jgi:hypothetical protein
MTDLETRVRDALTDQAEGIEPWRVSGSAVRATAVRRRSRRLTTTGMLGAVLAGLVAVAVVAPGGGDPDRRPVDQATSSPTPSATGSAPEPEASWRSVELTDAMWRKVVEAAGGSSAWSPIVATRVPGSDDVVVLVAAGRPPGLAPDPEISVMSVTLDSDRPGAIARSGTLGEYPSLSSIVSQPARLGDAAVLVVLLPNDVGDTVEVTTSRPGYPRLRTSGFVENRLALVPVTRPEEVTHLRVLRAGRAILDLTPSGALLGSGVPRTLDRVVASTDFSRGQPQGVQVRTDGDIACRMTVGSWWDGPPQIPWNPFDTACTPADGELHLLITEDRRYSSVAGMVPDGTVTVRLTWRSGSDTDVTETPVRNPGGVVQAFIDESGHRPDQLTRAEALDADGNVVATVLQ